MENKQNYAVYLKTVQVTVIKTLFELLKELLGDVNMTFTPDGLRILEMDQYRTLIVDLFMDKKRLETYYCPKNLQVGISIPDLYKVLKTMNSDNVLSMYIMKDNLSVLEILFESSNKTQQIKYKLNLMDLPVAHDLEFPKENYNLILNMSSADFKQNCTSVKCLNPKQLKITYSNGVYVFSAEGTNGCVEIDRIPIKNEEDDGDENEEEKSNYVYEGIFDIDKLTSFTKCSSISKNVKIYLNNDSPLNCRYELAFGELQLLLSNMEENA